MDLPNIEREQSKFEKYSKYILNNLEKLENKKLIHKHQKEALLAVKKYFDNQQPRTLHHPALVVAPTGAGKTGIIALLPYVLASKKTLILSPSVIITDQLESAFGLRMDDVKKSFFFERKLTEDVEFLKELLEKGKRIDNTENIQNMDRWNLVIVNAQKFGANSNASLKEPDCCDEETRRQIHKIRESCEKFSTLVVDEAHHYPASTWDLIVKEFEGKEIIFLTATPFRGIHRKALLPGQAITYSVSKRTLVELGIIRKINYQELSGDIDYDDLKDKILEIIERHDTAVETVKHKAMVLTTDTAEAREGAEKMGDIACYYTSEKYTEKYFDGFKGNKHKILFVCGKLIEGKLV